MIGNGAELADSAGFFSTGGEHLKNKNPLYCLEFINGTNAFWGLEKTALLPVSLTKQGHARTMRRNIAVRIMRYLKMHDLNWTLSIPIPEQALPVAYLCGSGSWRPDFMSVLTLYSCFLWHTPQTEYSDFQIFSPCKISPTTPTFKKGCRIHLANLFLGG